LAQDCLRGQWLQGLWQTLCHSIEMEPSGNGVSPRRRLGDLDLQCQAPHGPSYDVDEAGKLQRDGTGEPTASTAVHEDEPDFVDADPGDDDESFSVGDVPDETVAVPSTSSVPSAFTGLPPVNGDPLGDLLCWLDEEQICSESMDVGSETDGDHLQDEPLNEADLLMDSPSLPRTPEPVHVHPVTRAMSDIMSPEDSCHSDVDEHSGDEESFPEVPSEDSAEGRVDAQFRGCVDKDGWSESLPIASNGSNEGTTSLPAVPTLSRPQQGKPLGPCNQTPAPLPGTEEEEEWQKRKRLTGAVGRLVRYEDREFPATDILGLRSTLHGRIMVTGVQLGGNAWQAGVRAGDQLVSIDGKKVSNSRPASAVHESLKAPVTLVFLGFVGVLQAEVRVAQPKRPRCGLPSAAQVVPSDRTEDGRNITVCDPVVFGPSAGPSSSLFIATDVDTPVDEPYWKGVDTSCVYELGREDAKSLVQNAFNKIVQI